MAKRYEEKMKLEFEITRAHKCADLMKKGFMYRPGSTNYKMCQDIVPIVKVKPPKPKRNSDYSNEHINTTMGKRS